jgi:hypothetical protein
MSCREHSRALREVAAGATLPAALPRHLEDCAECRGVLATERALLDRIDGTLRQALAAEPSLALAGRVARAIQAGPPVRLRLPAPWLLPAAALVVVAAGAILVGRSIRTETRVTRETPRQEPEQRPSTVPAITTDRRPPAALAVRARPPRIPPVPVSGEAVQAPRRLDPPVIVAAAERDAVLSLYWSIYRDVRLPVMLASAAPDPRATELPPLVIAPLLVPPLGEEANPTQPLGLIVVDSIEGGGLR